MRFLKRRAPELLCILGTLTAASVLLAAAFSRKLIAGDDCASYPLFLSGFHQNLIHGNLFPAWAASMNFGYGEPYPFYRQPLDTYLMEILCFIFRHMFVAIDLCGVVTLAASALGMYLLSKRLLVSFFSEDTNTRAWGIATATVGYVLSPYVLYNFYSRADFSESICFAVFPWLTLALIRLAEEPTLGNIALAALAYCGLSLSHPAIHMITFPFILVSLFIARRHIRSWFAMSSAIALGLMASAYFWLPAIFERGYMKSSLATTGHYSYLDNLRGLEDVLVIPWHQTRGGLWFFPGFLFLFGVGVTLCLWATQAWETTRRPSSPARKTAAVLLGFSAVCVYFMHYSSAVWYESFAWLRMLQFPSRFLCPLTFFSCLLGLFAGAMVFRKPWHWQLLLGLLFLYGVQGVRRGGFSDLRPESFTPEAIVQEGWGWEPHYTLPATVAVKPTAPPARLVDLLNGQAELRCSRKSPSRVDCHVDSATASVLRLNVFDFPGWTAVLDGRPAVKTGRDASSGAMTLSLDAPGHHEVRWEIRDLWDRRLGKIITLLGWLGILSPLLLGAQYKSSSAAKFDKALSAFWRRTQASARFILDRPMLRKLFAQPWAIALALASGLIGYWFLPQVTHASLACNDEILHLSVIRQMEAVWARGGNILDFWSDYLILGQALMRMSHVLFYLFAWSLHHALPSGVSIETSLRACIFLCAVLTPWSFYRGARWLGFSVQESTLAALLYVLTFDSTGYGVGLHNYTFAGHGIDNQIFALLFFPLSLGLAHRALRGEGSIWSSALALAATWMSHLFVGYMASLWIAIDALLICAARPAQWRRIVGTFLGVHALFCLLAASYIYPILQDRLLQHKSLEEPEYKFLGLGAQETLGSLFNGNFLDAGSALPMISVFAAIGAILGLAALAEKPKALDQFNGPALPVHAAIWIALSFGPKTWGRLLYWLPFSRQLHWHRFIFGAETVLLLCGGVGLAGAFNFCASLTRRSSQKWAIGAILLCLFIPSLMGQQEYFMGVNKRLVLFTEEAWNNDTAFHQVLDFAKNHPEGRYYAGNMRNFGANILVAGVRLCDVLTEFDVDAVSLLYTSMAHTSTLFYRTDIRDPQDPRQEDLLNIRYVALPGNMPPRPGYTPVLKTGLVTLYDTGQRDGYFTIGTPGEKGCADSAALTHSVEDWMRSTLPEKKVFPLVELAEHCPKGTPSLEEVAQKEPAIKASGVILESGASQGDNSRRYWAKVRMDTPGLLVFKMNYHPAWRAVVNGAIEKPFMVVPAYQALILKPGVWDVQLEYRPSSMRGRLFIATLVLAAAISIAKFLPL